MIVIISFNIEIADFHYLDQFQSRVTESAIMKHALYLVWLLVVQVYQIQMKERMVLLISGAICGAQDAQIMLTSPKFLLQNLPTRWILIEYNMIQNLSWLQLSF